MTITVKEEAKPSPYGSMGSYVMNRAWAHMYPRWINVCHAWGRLQSDGQNNTMKADISAVWPMQFRHQKHQRKNLVNISTIQVSVAFQFCAACLAYAE